MELGLYHMHVVLAVMKQIQKIKFESSLGNMTRPYLQSTIKQGKRKSRRKTQKGFFPQVSEAS